MATPSTVIVRFGSAVPSILNLVPFSSAREMLTSANAVDATNAPPANTSDAITARRHRRCRNFGRDATSASLTASARNRIAADTIRPPSAAVGIDVERLGRSSADDRAAATPRAPSSLPSASSRLAQDVRATVIDDGKGFDTSEVIDRRESFTRLGLLGMRERAKLAGAALSITSRPSRGTRVTVTLRSTA